MDGSSASYVALLERLQALDPKYLTPAIKAARLMNWANNESNERGRKALLEKVQRELGAREAKKRGTE